jgi:hypothetical protein
VRVFQASQAIGDNGELERQTERRTRVVAGGGGGVACGGVACGGVACGGVACGGDVERLLER